MSRYTHTCVLRLLLVCVAASSSGSVRVSAPRAVSPLEATSRERGISPLLGWLDRRLARWRRRNRPKRIILVRHGESIGNVNSSAYSSTPDSQISLTERGFEQGTACGREIRRLVGNGSVRFYYSPYLRVRQTLLAILQAFEGQPVEIASEPRLREQDFGNFQDTLDEPNLGIISADLGGSRLISADLGGSRLQDPLSMSRLREDRMKFGRFFFRFPNGEAGTDVFDRVSDFIPRSGISPHISPYLGPRSGIRIHVSQPALERRRTPLYSRIQLHSLYSYSLYSRGAPNTLHTTVFTLPSSRPHVGGPQEGSAGRRSGRGGHSKI